MAKIFIETLGCKVNWYDSCAMAALLQSAGHEQVEDVEQADIAIINTCAVTGEAARKSRQAARKALRDNPNVRVIVAGCATQAEEGRGFEIARGITGTAGRSEILPLVEEVLRGTTVRAFPAQSGFEDLPADRQQGHTRAFMKVQEGCDAFCTYCLIPHLRGTPVSRTLASVAQEARRMASEGYREIVLVGINLSRYGCDQPGKPTLADAVDAAAVEGIDRIRLGSLEAEGLDRELIDRLSEQKLFCSQLHLSLQSGSASVLHRMGRRYTPEEFAERVDYARSVLPELAVTTDVIVGFPGETEEEFEESLAFVERMAFARVHVFRYSRRAGTPAAQMKPQISAHTAMERAERMAALSQRLERSFSSSMLGKTVGVLFETFCEDAPEYMEGYSENYIRVRARASLEMKGLIRAVKIIQAQDEWVVGTMEEG